MNEQKQIDDGWAANVARFTGFAAYDYDWPPLTPFLETDTAYRQLYERCAQLEQALPAAARAQQWDKPGHLERMRASGRFRFAREFAVHSSEMGDATRMINLILSLGLIETLLKRRCTEDELGLTAFRRTVVEVMGTEPCPWLFTYRVRLGIV